MGVDVMLLDPDIDDATASNMVGFIPDWLDPENPAPAKEQLDQNYRHGGGWFPTTGFTFDRKTLTLNYPQDPPMYPFAVMRLRDERIFMYPHAWVMILQQDGSFEVARMD
jgi:hypothetical protein